MDPNRALDDLHKKMRSRRVQMTAIRCDGSSDEQTPVPPAELDDLTFRFVPEHAVVGIDLILAGVGWISVGSGLKTRG